MSEHAVSVRGLGKRYRIGHQADPYGRLTETLSDWLRSPMRHLRRRSATSEEWFWALDDVSFDVAHGDVVGIIGRNGAGKSTLLKVLSRITEPTKGSADLRGRVASLLEVGTGFHPELSGRENIYLSGSILGMRREETQRRFDEIVEFAEIERFLDTPVKRYSSGMAVRLGFAVAAHLDTEILIVDEVLSVGDAAFQKKSIGRMHETARSGRTVLFVSHNLGAIADLTTKCLLLANGRAEAYGHTRDVTDQYLSQGHERERGKLDFDTYRRDRDQDSPVRVIAVSAVGTVGARMRIGDPLTIESTIEVRRRIKNLEFSMILRNQEGRSVAVLHSPDEGFRIAGEPGTMRVSANVAELTLTPGRYFIDVGVNRGAGQRAYDLLLDVPLIEVVNEGSVIHWTNRPWGAVHPQRTIWERKTT